jgi:hypothetical protein
MKREPVKKKEDSLGPAPDRVFPRTRDWAWLRANRQWEFLWNYSHPPTPRAAARFDDRRASLVQQSGVGADRLKHPVSRLLLEIGRQGLLIAASPQE